MAAALDDNLKCVICMDVCERPVTSPCQHNFCLKCFTSWAQRTQKHNCPKCRAGIPRKFALNPRVNTGLVMAIRLAKRGDEDRAENRAQKIKIANDARPEQAFTTKAAQRTGLANAASGKLFVTCPTDHFGPIGPEFDGTGSGRGLSVGDTWGSRLECRQYGAHFPHVAGIAGQSDVGAQSVVLAGGYEDDEDNGEWFLYTGSGGRDLSGNKRTNKEQSFDQEFTAYNKALLLSCQKGYPVRVVRSAKDKHSEYAPLAKENQGYDVRYDGIYRIAKCWRAPGQQGFLMCRYLFVRCDNEPAPWSSEEGGDRDGPLPDIKELKKEGDGKMVVKARGKDGKGKVEKTVRVYQAGSAAAWFFDPVMQEWGWAPGREPSSRKLYGSGSGKPQNKVSEAERLKKQFTCHLSTKKNPHILKDPVSTPCGHVFCMVCLVNHFSGEATVRDRGGGRSMRTKKVQKPCPVCKHNIADLVESPRVNRDMQTLIETLQQRAQEEDAQRAEAAGAEEEEGGQGAAAGPKKGAAPASKAASGSGSRQQSPPRKAPAASPRPTPPVEEQKAGKYANELEMLKEEFPSIDAGMIQCFLDDQEGDVKDVRYTLRVLKQQQEKEARVAKRQKTA